MAPARTRNGGGDADLQMAHLQDRRIGTAGRRIEAIAEPHLEQFACHPVGIDRNAVALNEGERPKVVDPMDVIGMLMGVENGIQAPDIGSEKLVAQIGCGIDQHRGDRAVRAGFFEQDRAAPAPVLGVRRIACAPADADARHAGG